VKALTDVSFDLYSGEVLALMGVNGAGKSTLMNVLGGIHQPDKGEVFINGEEVRIDDPIRAKELGIAFIQQEIKIFENLSVFENIFITELKGVYLPGKPRKEAKRYLDMLGLDINVNTKMSRLSVGEQQMVQIARALSQGGKIILFDEPTSSLSDVEKQNLFDTIRKLRDSGIAIVYITHYLDEVFEICDKAIVLRDGMLVGECSIHNTDKHQIISMMLGAAIDMEVEQRVFDESRADIVLEVENLTGKRGKPDDVSFCLRRGEILGIWGLLGSGRTEIIRNLLALDVPKNGRVKYMNSDSLVPVRGKALHKKAAYLTEGRHYDGMFANMPLWVNVTSTRLERFTKGAFKIMDVASERQESTKYLDDMNVAYTGETMLAKNLSGGNQQKMILSKWFMKEANIFFLDEPTKGVDVGAKMEIHRLIFDRAEKGNSFIVISSEFEEIMAMCDRILVINHGKLVNEVTKEDFSKETLMKDIVEGEA